MHTKHAKAPATTDHTNGAAKRPAALDAAHLSHLPKWAQEQPAAPLPLQTKLTVNQPGDVYEQEADRVADQVMRMPAPQVQRTCACGGAAGPDGECAACRQARLGVQRQVEPDEQDETLIQTQRLASSDPGMPAPPVVYQTLRSAGRPLDAPTRAFMEPRFGADFSQVRVHTDAQAAESAQTINARAYTVGHDIVFNNGQFSPGTQSGMQLLAHELTHVAQQSPSVHRKPSTDGSPIPGSHKRLLSVSRSSLAIQRKPFFFAPRDKPSGTVVHNAVLPLFLKDNKDLFIEAPIPGANKKDADKQATGRADFYKADATGGASRTIGIKMAKDEPAFLSGAQVEWGGGPYQHNKLAAPQGKPSTPKVRNLSVAPGKIAVGELKPGFSSESFLGQGQLDHYKSGITNTADAVNTYISANPTEADANTQWNPLPTTLTALSIPATITYPGGTAFPVVPLALYEETVLGVKRVLEDTGLRGRLFVYKDAVSGVWSYEWIPESIPATTGSGLVNTVLDRLNNNVIPVISAVPGGSGVVQKKPLPQRAPQIKRMAPKPAIQRVEQKFDRTKWRTKHYDPWKQEAEKFFADEKEVKQATVAKTLVDVSERSQTNIGIPTAVKERGKGLDKIRHWKRFGGLYGWLREKFDFIYVKLQKFGAKVKEKIKKFTGSAKGVKFGNWIKAAAQVIFKIFKLVGAWAVRETVNKLIESFREGMQNNIKKLVDMATPEGVKSKIEEFEELKEQYNQIIKEQEDAIITLFFGDKLELFEKLSEFEAIANKVSTIVSLVEWGVRLLACASPPAIGCLWNLAISALQAAFALLIQTCWFTKKVYQPVISNVDMVRNFPAQLAGQIISAANTHIPVPEGLDPLFAPVKINTSEFNVDCDEGGDGGARLTPEREAILALLEEIGAEKFNALLELMLKRGAGPWVLLTAERLAELKDKLKDVSTEELKALATDPKKTAPVALEEFLTSIAQYTAREKRVAKAFFEAKAKAEAAKVAAGKGGGKEPDGASGAAKPKGDGGKGAGGGVVVLDGKAHPIKEAIEKAKPSSRILAYVVDAAFEHAKTSPDIITADIYVDGVLRYRVKDIRVRATFGGEMLATPNNIYLVIYYLQDGLQLNIDGTEVYWEQLQWSKRKEE